jgi:alpha-L-arabinofuranosidase
MITAANDAANSIANPTNIHPTEGPFTTGSSFTYTFPARSMTVLRIRVLK